MCPICSSSDRAHDRTLYDDRYGYAGRFDLFACRACGHRWLDWQPDPGTLSNLYSECYPRRDQSVADLEPRRALSPFATWWRGDRASASAWIPRDVRVLDIGCGFGEALRYHRERGCEVSGVEADPNVARVAAALGLDVRIGLFDATDYTPSSFDVVTMDQVIEHVTAPLEVLAGVRTVLKPGGSLVLSTPNAGSVIARLFGRRWINWHAPYHLHFFSRDSLARAADAAGLALETLETITSPEWLSYQWIHALTMPRHGARSLLWSPRDRTWRVRSLRALRWFGVEAVMTRVLDELRVGDNFVARLRRP